MWEAWCDFELCVDPSRPPDPVEVASASPSGGRSAHPPTSVHGLRYRLEAIDPTGTSPLPSNGKIVVKVCDREGCRGELAHGTHEPNATVIRV